MMIVTPNWLSKCARPDFQVEGDLACAWERVID